MSSVRSDCFCGLPEFANDWSLVPEAWLPDWEDEILRCHFQAPVTCCSDDWRSLLRFRFPLRPRILDELTASLMAEIQCLPLNQSRWRDASTAMWMVENRRPRPTPIRRQSWIEFPAVLKVAARLQFPGWDVKFQHSVD